MDRRLSPTSPLCCEICFGRKFANSETFRRHLKTQRHLQRSGCVEALNDTPRYSCTVCSATFSRPANLARHCNDCHANEPAENVGLTFKCEACSKRFSSLEGKIRHLVSHRSNPTDRIGASQAEEILLLESFEITTPPGSPHCITILFPSVAGDTQHFSNNNDCCSIIERHGFALVLLSCCLKMAIGDGGALRIVACEGFHESMLAECAKLLSLSNSWSSLSTHITRFNTLNTLQDAMAVSDFVRSPFSIHSLFVVGHADPTRLRVTIGGKRVLIPLAKIADLVHRCEPNHVHVMSCKSQKLSTNLQRLCDKRGLCLDAVWCSYGDEDVTTVPFDFGSPITESVNWLSAPLSLDFDTSAHTHMTASIQAFLCSLSVGHENTYEEVVRSTKVPIHHRAGLALCSGHVYPHNARMGGVDKLFPSSRSLVGVLARVGVSWPKFKWWLRKLEQTPLHEFNYV